MVKNKSIKTVAIVCSIIIAIIAIAALLIIPLVQNNRRDSGSKQTFAVAFYSNDGTILKIDTVEEHKSATPPVQPEMSYGNIFVKWDKDFSEITSDVDVYPITQSIKGERNVFALSGAYLTNDSEAIVPLQLSGDVLISGFEMNVKYDYEKMELLSVFDVDGGIVYNDSELGIIKLNYVSVENTIADVDICTFKFKVKADNGEIPIKLNIVNAYVNDGDNMNKADYITIDSSVFVY